MNEEVLRKNALLLWEDVVQAAHSFEDASVLPWLSRVKPVSFDGLTLIVSTSQKWTEHKLMNQYREQLESVLRDITMEAVSLLVVYLQDSDAQSGVVQTSVPDTSSYTSSSLSAASQAGIDASRGISYIRPSILSPTQPMPAVRTQDISSSYTPNVVVPPPETVSSSVPASPSYSPATSARPGLMHGSIHSDYTFDTYVVGESNLIAYNMATCVAEQPDGRIFNPLFVWGPSGIGKTHLLLAIRQYIYDMQPFTYVRYVTANAFVTQYVDDIRNKKLKGHEVLSDYRDVDVLLVDDIQFFEDKQESVTAFFDIFNNLMIAGGKQIVLAADRAPDYLRLDARMKTRFNQGMVADIKAPTYEMKLSILKSFYERCKKRNGMDSIVISDEAFDLMAKQCPNNPRNMLGLINNILFRAELDPSILTPDGILNTIETVFRSTTAVTVASIMKAVAAEMNITVDQMKSDSRIKDIKEARQIVMWLASQLTDEPYSSIGKALNRDHSTVSHAIKKINEQAEADKGYMNTLESLKSKIVQ